MNYLLLAQKRKAAGLTQTELAKRAGLSKSFVCEIESRQRNISVETLEAICDVLEASPAEFFSNAPVGFTVRYELRDSDGVRRPGTLQCHAINEDAARATCWQMIAPIIGSGIVSMRIVSAKTN